MHLREFQLHISWLLEVLVRYFDFYSPHSTKVAIYPLPQPENKKKEVLMETKIRTGKNSGFKRKKIVLKLSF